MAELSRKLRSVEGNGLMFRCPGCGVPHRIQYGPGPGLRWQWNGDAERPTFTPSVLVRWKEPSDDPALFADEAHDIAKVCHSFVVDGHIQFLGDCTHALAGQTVEIPDFHF